MTPKLFIGMPVYNAERFLNKALETLVSQTYTDWELVISDNASTDSTPSICQQFASADARVHYIRQETNLGAISNFRFLLDMAGSPYFMWAAADDLWREDFIEACVSGLESSAEVGWAFTNVENIDSFARTIRDYPSFTKFVNADRAASIASFALDPEWLGKANLIYGIYKLDILKEFMLSFLNATVMHFPSADLAFDLGILCRTFLYIDERVLFCKRIANATDTLETIERIEPVMPYLGGMIKAKDFAHYKQAAALAAEGTPYANLIHAINQYREMLISDVERKSTMDATPFTSVLKQRVYAKASWEWRKLTSRFSQS